MHQAMLEGKGKTVLEDLLARLVDYTNHHFAHEEQLMERIHYPDYRQHQLQHADLCSKVRTMQDRSTAGEATMTIEVMEFIVHWLKFHTTTSDRRIGEYMKTKEK
jgi:hemerythrin